MVPKPVPLVLFLASINGFLGVTVGAFGTHALKGTLDPHALSLVDLASRYLLIHGAAGLGIALTVHQGYGSPKVGLLMEIGAFIFALALLLIAIPGWHWAGALAPLGGTALLVAWGWLMIGALSAFNARH